MMKNPIFNLKTGVNLYTSKYSRCKQDVTIEYLTHVCSNRETIDSFACIIILSVYFVDKNRDQDLNCSFDFIYFQFSILHHINLSP